MRDKYIEERFPRYFKFGTHLDTGLVDCASTNMDTVATVTNEHLNNLIKDRDAVVDMLCLLAKALDETDHKKFVSIWYNNLTKQ